VQALRGGLELAPVEGVVTAPDALDQIAQERWSIGT
jgi:hypothetical protein